MIKKIKIVEHESEFDFSPDVICIDRRPCIDYDYINKMKTKRQEELEELYDAKERLIIAIGKEFRIYDFKSEITYFLDRICYI